MHEVKEDLEPLRHIRIHHILGLEDNGKRQQIKCPFHKRGQERTPSFALYPDNSYNCFGCDANGQNAIDFLLETGESFGDVIKELRKYI